MDPERLHTEAGRIVPFEGRVQTHALAEIAVQLKRIADHLELTITTVETSDDPDAG